MAEPSIPDFLNALATSQLLTDAQVASLKKQLVDNPMSVEALAQVLVKQKHLTGWQARQLRKGQTGFILQQYRLLNPIGRGGMGHVFRARAAQADGDVAVKVMARRLTGNETLVSRFRREIRASSKLNNRHIVRTMDAGRVGKVDFMVMEYVNGDQVDRIANRIGRVPVGLSCEIVRQAALGLQHAHDHRMVHRDIKPANIMVHWDDSEGGIVKLMDMGLVLVMSDEADEKTVTRAGQVMGTPDFMSPEQGWDTTKVDIRSDIYSLGCTLFRLLTGKIPFTGSNPLQVLSQRLQRDAPSVRTVCDDIPEEVAAVVCKMTMRDPDARYQTPQEVADALAAVSEPLTVNALRAAARNANADDDIDLDDSDNDEQSDAVHESDGTYREFLQEVEEGSAVDLMLATDPGDSPAVATAPVLNLDITPRSRPATGNRKAPKRGQQAGFIALGVGTAIVGLLIIVAMSGGGGDVDPADPQHAAVVEAKSITPTPEATFEETKAKAALAGETWTHSLETTVTVQPTDGILQFVAGDAAPADLTVDPETGEVSWKVPTAQTVGDYTVPIRLVHIVGDTQNTIAETKLSVSVKRSMLNVQLPEPRVASRIAEPGKPFSLSMAVDSDSARSFRLSYRINGQTPDGLEIDADSGMISWRPTDKQLGRHAVLVAVVQEKRERTIDTELLSLLVVPNHVKHVLPEIAPQPATAGTLFRFELPKSGLGRNSKVPLTRIIEAGPGAPPGLTISPRDGEVMWQVPEDVVGTVRVSLLGKLEGPGITSRSLDGAMTLEINVAAASAPPVPKSTMPPEDEIKTAIAALRDTYRSTIAQARTTADKAMLANRLLLQCENAKAGPSDAALLQLIQVDLAEKARATDVLLAIGKLRTDRYGTDELAEAQETIKSFRKTGLSQVQQDLVIEHGLRLAKDSIAAANYSLTEELLSAVKSLLSRGAAGASALLYADVSSADEIATELAKASDGAIDRIKADELRRLVARWQFAPVFGKSSSNVFIQASPTQAVPGNGRDLWTIEDDRIALTSETQGSMVGFLDSSQQLDRYVLRFQLMPDSNCAQVVFAAAGSDDFSAHTVILNSSVLGRISAMSDNAPLNDSNVKSQAQVYMDVPNLVEVAVDGPLVVVRLNGTLLSKAQIPALPKGWLGLAADLRRPEPKLTVTQPRILVLPEEP